MIYCVEVLAIYEAPGVNPTGQRLNQRDSDFALARQRADAVGRAVDPQANEYMETFDSPTSRYGTGWRCRVWISTSSDATTVGNALWTRLSTRSLQPGSKVEVFPKDDTVSGYSTGDATFRRRVPSQGDDIG
jgi:hypothetical protein